MALAFDANLGTVTDTATLTTSAAAASASRVFMFVWWFGTQTATGASGGSLTWVVDHQFRGSNGGDQNIAVISADAPSGLASSTVLTPSFSATPSFGPGIAAASFTGAETGASGYVDVTSTGKDDFEEAWTTNNLVTTNADDLLLALSLGDGSSGNTAATDYTEIHDWIAEGSQRCATVYRIVAATSTYTPGGTWAGTVNFQTNIGVAYKAAGAGEPPIEDAPETLRVVRAPVLTR